jgi:Tol biopolymer transport system component
MLGPYRILDLAGAGGMGEVYRATDTRLDRIVAIKALPPHLSSDSELRDRFEREARAVAALNHPHICTLYDVGHQDGTHFLVMEYLDGETLAERLGRGALPLSQALKYAVEIAGGLDRAHRLGIVHRDLKPGNVMLTKSGAKLLDFGLARLKPAGPAAAFAAATGVPTELPELTARGTILGTLQYMAPEQLEGKEADARTDVFAFGAVLYEMVTGRKAFEGKTQVSVIGAILERDPAPVSTLQPASPPTLDAVIKRCLAKDPEDRWQSAADLSIALKWIEGPPSSTSTVIPAPVAPLAPIAAGGHKRWMIAAALFALTTLGLGALELNRYRSATAPEVMRFSILPPDKTTFADPIGLVSTSAGVISPDGRKLAFTAKDAAGKFLLWVRQLDSLNAQPLPNTDDALLPFWSPDSRWIGFGDLGNKLKRVDIAGGGTETLCEGAGIGGAGAWSREGTILVSSQTGIQRVGPSGCTAITKVTSGEFAHVIPAFLPDGRHFVYYSVGSSPDKSGVHLAALDSTDDRLLLNADSAAVVSKTGHLLFVRQGTLLAQPFDFKALKLTGPPVRIAQPLASDLSVPGFSISDTGILTYRTGAPLQDVQLAWYDRSGKRLETVGPTGNYRGVDLSPDGKRVAVHRHDGNDGDIWVFEPRGTVTRLTFDASQENVSPIWSPDGRFIAYGSTRNGKVGLYRKPSDGTGAEELLVESEIQKIPAAWSADNHIVYWLYDKGGVDQWLLSLADRKSTPLMNSKFYESHSQISPDSKWIAYVSDQTGRPEIYVRPFPSGEGRWQVSTAGGNFPRWRADGKEMFYFNSTNPGGTAAKVMAVSVQSKGTTFEAATPHELFDSGYYDLPHIGKTGNNYHTYAVSPDGQRFLIPRPAANSADLAPSPITVVLNWTSMLKQ